MMMYENLVVTLYVTTNCAIAPPCMYLIRLKRIAHGDANERVNDVLSDRCWGFDKLGKKGRRIE